MVDLRAIYQFVMENCRMILQCATVEVPVFFQIHAHPVRLDTVDPIVSTQGVMDSLQMQPQFVLPAVLVLIWMFVFVVDLGLDQIVNIQHAKADPPTIH
jgi:hypothetical protein